MPISALVRLRTVNVAGSRVVETPAAELVASTMRGFGWDVTVTEVAPGRPNVIAEIHGARTGRTLMFEGHLDVVTEHELVVPAHPAHLRAGGHY